MKVLLLWLISGLKKESKSIAKINIEKMLSLKFMNNEGNLIDKIRLLIGEKSTSIARQTTDRMHSLYCGIRKIEKKLWVF
jgi:hypothetical protein